MMGPIRHVNIDSFHGYRLPLEAEIRPIYRAVARQYERNHTAFLTVSAVFSLVAAALLLCGIISFQPEVFLFSIPCMAASFLCVHKANLCDQYIRVFVNGQFSVADGCVNAVRVLSVKKTPEGNTPTMVDVKFLSEDGQELTTWFQALPEDVCLGTPLLLVHVSDKLIPGGFCGVFTPYMLTDKGISDHW